MAMLYLLSRLSFYLEDLTRPCHRFFSKQNSSPILSEFISLSCKNIYRHYSFPLWKMLNEIAEIQLIHVTLNLRDVFVFFCVICILTRIWDSFFLPK